MSRYLAFVLLALSASTALAAPAEIPQLPAASDATAIVEPLLGTRAEIPQLPTVPNLDTVTVPLLGPRPSTLRKRDLEYPSSTKDCLSSEVSDGADAFYTHNGQDYSEDCLTHLALSVPSEKRKSCRTTGPDAHGYDEKCLFKKALEEDWKFDVEKAKEDERAWRAANPEHSSSDVWKKTFPGAISHCITVGVDVEGEKEKEKEEKEEKEKKEKEKEKEGKDPKKEGSSKTSDETSDWKSYSLLSTGEKIDDVCVALLIIRAKIVVDLKTCSIDKKSSLDKSLIDKIPHDKSSTDKSSSDKPSTDKPSTESGLTDALSPQELGGLTTLLSSLLGRSTTELAARQNLSAISVALSVLLALNAGCLVKIVAVLVATIGLEVEILSDPLDGVVGLLTGLLALLDL